MSEFEPGETPSSITSAPGRKPWLSPEVILATLADDTEKVAGGSDVSFTINYSPNGAS